MSSTPRTRSRSSGPESSTVENTYIVGTGPATQGSFVDTWETEVMEDVVSDNYDARIKSGEIINNPCDYTVSRRTNSGAATVISYNPPYTGTKTTVSQTGPMTQYMLSTENATGYEFLPSFAPSSASVEEAKAKAIANIERTPFAFGEDIGEIRETLRFLRNPIATVYNTALSFRHDLDKLSGLKSSRQSIADRVRRKNRDVLKQRKAESLLARVEQIRARHLKSATRRELRNIASVWAEYQWALLPTVRSISDAMEAYYTPVRGTVPERLSARGYSSSFEELSGTHTYTNRHTFASTSSLSVDIKASILYEITNPVRDWRYKLGLRGKDIPTTAWQLMPLSFMVDRVIDISSFSAGVMNMLDPHVKILSACVRTKTEKLGSVQYTGYVPSTLWSASGQGNTLKDTDFRYQREPWTPLIQDTVPTFKPLGLVEDATKVFDLAAVSTLLLL